MIEASRTATRSVATRNVVRDVDVYGGAGEPERAQPNIFAVIWRRRWIVLTCVILALGAGIAYYAKATPVYSSSAVVYVQDNALKIVNDPMGGGSRSSAYLFTQCQVLTSTANLSEALLKPGVAGLKTLRGASNPVGVLKSSIVALPDKQSDLINVSMESTSPDDAAALVNAAVEAYIDYQGKSHRSTAVEVLRIFQKEVDQHEANLHKAQMAMLKLKQDNPDLTFQTSGGNLVFGNLGKLSDALSNAQLRALDVSTAAAEAEVVKDDPIALRRLVNQFQIQAADEGASDPALMSAYRSSRQRLNELLDNLGSRHELVQTATRQLGRLQEEIQLATRETAASYSAILKQTQRIADVRVAELKSAMEATRKSAVDLNFKQAEYDQLRKDEERITRALDLLDNRIKEINVNEDVGSLTVSVLETAKPNGNPVRPVQSKVLGMALVAGLMAGVGLAMLRDLMDQRLRSADEIMALLDLPILGVVPHINTRDKNAKRGQLVHAQPRSQIAEAYRTIRTALSFGTGDGHATKTILVTSPAPGDGKSTCASNLALAFAQLGRRTLLIDADCRRPTQDRNYDVEDGKGLADVLSGQCKLSDAIRPSGMPNLDLLLCGTIPHNPAELLDSQALLDLLGRVSGEYEQVLIDSPPVIAVTDARVLAASCDASVLVLRAERSTRRLSEHARDALLGVGANLLGVVVNDIPRGASGYGYDYYGGYGGYNRYGYKSLKTNGVATHNDDAGALSVTSGRTIDG